MENIMTDVPLSADLKEVYAEAQKRVDRVVLARIELGAAISDLLAGRDDIFAEAAAAVKFIDDYINPTVPNPEPIAPEVAVELPPEAEIPVFTTVDDEPLAAENTSGGELDITEEVMVEEFGEFVPAEPVEFIEDEGFVPNDNGVS